MKTIRAFFSMIAVAASSFAFAQGNGDIKVVILDNTGSPLYGANAVVTSAGSSVGGGTTNDNGVVFIRGMKPSKYDVKINAIGFKGYIKKNVTVEAGQTANVSFKLEPSDASTITGVVIESVYEPSPVKKEFSTIKNIDSEIIQNGAFQPGDIKGMVTAFCSSCSEGKGGQLVMRGAREGASQVYVDGEKIYGSSSVPGLSIQQVSILSGGIPAEFGDLSGGAIIITTQDYMGGMQNKYYRNTMAAEEEEIKKKEADKKSGKVKEENGVIIEDSNGGN